MESKASYFIKVKNLAKKMVSGPSTLTILKDINLIIKPGETIAIKGRSGGGKTTLLTLLAGLDLPTSGLIYWREKILNEMTEEERTQLRGQSMGFIFQSFHLLNSLTALQNVMLPLEIRYVAYKTAEEAAITWLTRLGLEDRLNHFPSELSGGEQQRIAIARAFVTNPEIIFADEMTGSLDADTGNRIADLLFSLNKKNKTTLVLVTHDNFLAERCDKCFILDEGTLIKC